MKAVICGALKGWNKFLPKCFSNIKRIGSLFNEYTVIISYDDYSPIIIGEREKLEEVQKSFINENVLFEIINKPESSTNIRTENISNARNSILDFISTNEIKSDYMIMMDLDNVSGETDVKLEVMDEALQLNTWDCMTFNRPDYYDIWALCFDEFTASCFQFDFLRSFSLSPRDDSKQIICYKSIMKSEITKRLKESIEPYPVYSAFNGFGIYKPQKFAKCRYDWKTENTFKYFSYDVYLETLIKYKSVLSAPITYNNRPSDCEHRHFHFQSHFEYGAKHFINPVPLF